MKMGDPETLRAERGRLASFGFQTPGGQRFERLAAKREIGGEKANWPQMDSDERWLDDSMAFPIFRTSIFRGEKTKLC